MPGRRRLPRGTLTPDGIIDAALTFIDEHGLDALTIRHVAGALGASPMALYRHFADKQQLLDAILDHVIAGFNAPALPETASWREQVVAFFAATRETLVAHPGVAQLIASGPSSTPATLQWTDAAVGLFLGAGLDGADAVAAYTAFVLYTAGFALWELAESNREWHDRRSDDIKGLLADYPHLLAVRPHLARRATIQQFHYGLDRFLDGVDAALHDQAVTGHHARRP